MSIAKVCLRACHIFQKALISEKRKEVCRFLKVFRNASLLSHGLSIIDRLLSKNTPSHFVRWQRTINLFFHMIKNMLKSLEHGACIGKYTVNPVRCLLSNELNYIIQGRDRTTADQPKLEPPTFALRATAGRQITPILLILFFSLFSLATFRMAML